MYKVSDFSFSFQRILVARIIYYYKGLTQYLAVVVISTSLMASEAEYLPSVIRCLQSLFAEMPIQVFCLFLFNWISGFTIRNCVVITVYYRYKSFICHFTFLVLSSKLQKVLIFDDIIGIFLSLHFCYHGT